MPLIIDPWEEPLARPYTLLEHRFWGFHRRNPHLLDEIIRIIRQKRIEKKNWDKWGMKAIFEIMRWEKKYLRTEPTDGLLYKIANTHAPYYARLVLRLLKDELPERFMDIRMLTNPPFTMNVDREFHYGVGARKRRNGHDGE